MPLPEPELTHRREAGHAVPMLVWRPHRPLLAISSAPLGGGIGVRHWVLNATVPMSYDRDDPDAHLADLAARAGLDGPGIGLLTGVDVAEVAAGVDGEVAVWATVGLGTPIWAAAPSALAPAPAPPPAPAPASAPAPGQARSRPPAAGHVGTINIVAYAPERLSDAALVNAVATITEAKAQALWQLGVAATGTATDAVTLLCPPDGAAAPYGGPRSQWGAALARATAHAVRLGGGRPTLPWSDRTAGADGSRDPSAGPRAAVDARP